MDTAQSKVRPRRISDLVALKEKGIDVAVKTRFDIVPVDFTHRRSHYQAFIFLCRYRGEIDGVPFEFRKCYARGCPNNLCQHVAQAVLIANRHLARDYKALENVGIDPGDGRFILEDMMVKFDGIKESDETVYTIYDFVKMAKEGTPVKVVVELEEVPAVEHFDNKQNAQTFLFCTFGISAKNRSFEYQRCLACYATDNKSGEKELAIRVANARLEDIYKIFCKAGVEYGKRLFDL